MSDNTRFVLLTGAAGGLGAAACRRLADAGWNVLAADLPGDALDRIGTTERIDTLPLDVTDSAAVSGLADRVREHTARLAGVVNFAGILEVGPMIEMPEERLRRIIEVNVFGTFRVNQALFPLIEAGRGRIVNISSETGWQSGGPFNGAYAMSKHAIEAYSDSLRREVQLLGIRVVKVQPGPFRTAMVESIRARFQQAEHESTRFAAALGRTGELAAEEQGRAHDPDLLAQVVEKALTVRRPRAAYSVRPARSRAALEWLPTRVGDLAIRYVLTH